MLIEAGPQVATAFLSANLVDEVSWFRAARGLGPALGQESGQEPGAGAVPAFHGNALEKLAFVRQAVLQAGPDQWELYIRKA